MRVRPAPCSRRLTRRSGCRFPGVLWRPGDLVRQGVLALLAATGARRTVNAAVDQAPSRAGVVRLTVSSLNATTTVGAGHSRGGTSLVHDARAGTPHSAFDAPPGSAAHLVRLARTGPLETHGCWLRCGTAPGEGASGHVRIRYRPPVRKGPLTEEFAGQGAFRMPSATRIEEAHLDPGDRPAQHRRTRTGTPRYR